MKMEKASAKEYYERIILLRVQLFLRAVAFAGTLLIFSTLYRSGMMEKPLERLSLQESYASALIIVFSVSAAAAAIDLPVRFFYKRIRNRLVKKHQSKIGGTLQ